MARAAAPAADVCLGVAGDLCRAGDEVSCLVTKVGGAAVWIPNGPPGPDLVRCPACGGTMTLFLQASAPLIATQTEGSEIPVRSVYLLSCLKDGCGGKSGSWRAWRGQLRPDTADGAGRDVAQGPSEGGVASTSKEDAPNTSDSGRVAPADPWATAGDGWGIGGGWGAGPSTEAGAVSVSDLAAALEETLSKAGPSKRQGQGQGQGPAPQRANPSQAGVQVERMGPPSGLPPFYLVAQEEPAGAAGRGGKWAARFEAAMAGAGAPGDGADEEELPGGVDDGGADAPVLARAGWQGEVWEEDSALGAAPAYLKFQERLLRSPEQCVRYGFRGATLWPARAAPQAPPCAACGAPRVFEMQAMAPVLAMLSEARDWHVAEGAQAGGLASFPGAWEWLTVGVWACARSCHVADGDVCYVEEHVAVATE